MGFGKSCCDCCSNYVYDAEYDEYYCAVEMDEDEAEALYQFQTICVPPRGFCCISCNYYTPKNSAWQRLPRQSFLRQYRTILSADTASEVRQLLSQKRR